MSPTVYTYADIEAEDLEPAQFDYSLVMERFVPMMRAIAERQPDFVRSEPS